MSRLPCLALALLGCGKDTPDSSDPTSPPGSTTWMVGEPYPPDAPAVDWFVEVTETTGLDAVHQVEVEDPSMRLAGAGAAIGDVDGDGVDDVVLALGSTPPRLFLGTGGLQFVASSVDLGSDSASSAVLADLDGDGALDLVLGRDDFDENTAGSHTVRLLRGDGRGDFTDVTDASGLGARSLVKALGIRDVDRDGLLDLYVAIFGASRTEVTGREDLLYRNRGDGSFDEIGAGLGIDQQGLTWVFAAFDADGDGRDELFAGNDSFTEDDGSRPIEPAAEEWQVVPDLLLTDQGPGADGLPTFVEHLDPAVNEPRGTMHAIAQDMDGDGLLDLYLSDFGRNELLIRQPDGSYLDKTHEAGLAAAWREDSRCPAGGWDIECLLVGWGAAYVDFDLDGVRDLIQVNGQILADDGRQPVALWRGRADGTYEAVQAPLPWMDARALLTHDLDGDGDLDLVITTWAGPVRVFENRTRQAADPPGFATLDLVGTSGPLDGSGTHVRRGTQVYEVGTGGSPWVAHATRLHLGLGDGGPAALELVWPTGLRQDVAAGATRVVEPRLFSVSDRVLPADGSSEVVVEVTPRDASGALVGSGRVVDVESSLGTWTGPVVDQGDGSYVRTLNAPSTPGMATITITIDGAPVWIQPRVVFQ